MRLLITAGGLSGCLMAAALLSLLYEPGSGFHDAAQLSQLTLEHPLIQLRLPRTLAALMIGGGLGLSANLLQIITRNPLAEPGLLGINAGGVLGIAWGLSFYSIDTMDAYMLWAIAGTLGATALIRVLAELNPHNSPSHLILVGVAISALLGGAAHFLLLKDSTALERFRFWNLGSLSGISFSNLLYTLPFVLGALCLLLLTGRYLGALQFGQQQAASLGVPTRLVVGITWLQCALFTACAIALAGPMMFAGFLAALLSRSLAGNHTGRQLLLSGLMGALLLLIADLISRSAVAPFELPTGVVLVLVGAPVTIAVVKKGLLNQVWGTA